MANKQAAHLAEAVELLRDTKHTCFPSLEREIDKFIADPESLDKAKELLEQVKSNCGMIIQADINRILNKTSGIAFNERDFFYEKMPGEQ